MPILIVTIRNSKSKGIDKDLTKIKPLILDKLELKIAKQGTIKVLATVINLAPDGT